MNSKMAVWRLRSGLDRRFRSGHPWVYSNELTESPKGLAPGSPVELQDAGGKFLARGYGNPHSLIAFRALSRDPAVEAPHGRPYVLKTLLRASQLRARLGLSEVSHRLCFGEADGLPGLVVDRYVLAAKGKVEQFFSVQLHTAGADLLTQDLLGLIEALVNEGSLGDWKRTGVLLDRDLGVRKLEGVEVAPAEVLREIPGVDLSRTKIRVASALGHAAKYSEFEVDLRAGQKTGFFLDQWGNVQLTAMRLSALPVKKSIRILDLCSYVGQWGAQLGHVFKQKGVEVEVTAVDASARALEFAQRNIESQGVKCRTLEADALKDLGQLEDRSFDLVICDPPALIKGRKDLPTGTHAYLQLNTQAIRLVREGGAIVTCSCSGLLEEEAFVQTLSKAAYRNKREVRWVGRGSQAPDHPVRAEFPEGRYLKCWIGLLD